MPNTVNLHRVLAATPERLYRAFLDPAALVKWLPPHGFTGTVHSLHARVGGGYQMSFSNFSTGHSHSFAAEFVELQPHTLIRYNNHFDDPNLPGLMQVTVKLKPVSCGTEMHITQEGIPDVIPVEACYLGWQQSLELLAQLTDPDMSDQA